jgi:hypothetical protein
MALIMVFARFFFSQPISSLSKYQAAKMFYNNYKLSVVFKESDPKKYLNFYKFKIH